MSASGAYGRYPVPRYTFRVNFGCAPENVQKLIASVNREIAALKTNGANPKDIAKLKAMLEEIHESFKTEVRTRRGAKLDEKNKELFTGAYWTGRKAVTLGLIDGIAHMEAELRRKFGDKIELKEITAPKGWGLKRLGFGAATELPEAALNAIEHRALWQGFGL